MLGHRPQDRVLEAGCGTGVAAGLVCATLTTGHLLAVDRSATAVARALARNEAYVESGVLTVRRAALAGLDVEPRSFDRAFAVNVNVFWTSPAADECAALARALRPGGRLCVLYDAGPTAAERVVAGTWAALEAAGFDGLEAVHDSAGAGVTGRAPARR
nr:class I SAM-dependent methyltransferase [Motilibacter deserti]